VSCHNEKMEAYCNIMRSLEDKFYGIELNHAPPPLASTRRRANSRRSRQGESPFPRTISCETSLSRSSTSIRHPRIRKNPWGLPLIQWVQNPWTRTP
jgi:hypothetical protein